MSRFFQNFCLFLFFLIIFCSIVLFSVQSKDVSQTSTPTSSFYFSNSDFLWPLPGYHHITSYFGPRISPTTGASSTHSGIDIAAPEGTIIYAVITGTVSSTGFGGANGHTITVESNNLTIMYCHVSPNYLVAKGDTISKGEQVGNVGPKYITDVPNNPYKDSSGKNTNGATTGTHLHLTIKKDGIAVNPLNYLTYQ